MIFVPKFKNMSARSEIRNKENRIAGFINNLMAKIRPYVLFALVPAFITATLKSYYINPTIFWALLNSGVILGLLYLISSLDKQK